MVHDNHLVLVLLGDREGIVMGLIKHILGLPLLAIYWLFALFVKLRLWMKVL
jgi:hypothetical protein